MKAMEDKRTLYILIFTVVFIVCASNPQWFSSHKKEFNIKNEVELKPGVFIGRRDTDNRSNIYSRSITGWLFPDTIRKYFLKHWYELEYDNEDEGHLIFKGVVNSNDLKVPFSSLRSIDDDYIREVMREERQKLAKETAEKRKFEETHFDITNASDQKLYDFIQGDWTSYQYLSGVNFYYKISIVNRRVLIKKYVYVEDLDTQEYADKNNAPYETILDCELDDLSRRYIEIGTDGLAQNEDIVFLNFSASCNNPEEYTLFLKRSRSRYADKEENNEVSLMANLGKGRIYLQRKKDF